MKTYTFILNSKTHEDIHMFFKNRRHMKTYTFILKSKTHEDIHIYFKIEDT
jgi:hypothetical protein